MLQRVFYILLGFPPPLTPPAYELTPFGSACIFTIKNIAALGHTVKIAEDREEVVQTPFNSTTSREEAHAAACQTAHPERRKDY